jgi:CRP/FNR family cyclic AMP-dependent transcriptional regulator
MDDIVSSLANSVVCEDFHETEIADLAKVCKVIRFQPGEVMIVDDARERDIYFIKSGRVEINLSGPSASDHAGTIRKIGPGQVVGELGFIDGLRRSTWVVAIDEIEAIRLSWEDFYKLTENNGQIGYKFMYSLACVIAERLRDVTMTLSNLLDVRGRR